MNPAAFLSVTVRTWLSLCLFHAAGPALGQPIPSSTPRKDLWMPNGPVYSIVETNGIVYLGGDFSSLSRGQARTALLDTGTGLSETRFPSVNGAVLAAVPDGEGGWYLGGQFTSVGGQPRTNLARIRNDQSVDETWRLAANDTVHALAVSGDRVYLGGRFTAVSSQLRRKLAAVDATTGALATWDPNVCCDEPGESPSRVLALVVDGARVFAGGSFTSAGGQPRHNLAMLDAASGIALPWPDNSESAGGVVDALCLSDGQLFVGGQFAVMGGAFRNNLASVDATSGMALPWNPAANGTVHALAVTRGIVYAGGNFTFIGGQSRGRGAALEVETGAVTAWNPNADGEVRQLVCAGSVVFAGGSFTHIGLATRPGLAALDGETGQATAWIPAMPGRSTQCLALNGRQMLVGNQLAEGDVFRGSLAAFEARTGRMLDWNPRADGAVFALAVADDVVYAGGDFLNVNDAPRVRFAAIDATTGVPLPWSTSASGPNGRVEALAVTSNVVYVSGGFTAIGQSFSPGLVAMERGAGQRTSWRPVAGQAVHALALSGDTIYAAGAFSMVGTKMRRGFAALDATTGLATDWDPSGGGTLADGWTLQPARNLLYVGGSFTGVGGAARLHLAALDPDSGLATSWNPGIGSLNDVVQHLSVNGNHVYVGGLFSQIGGQSRNNAALIDAVTAQALGWDPNPRTATIGVPVAVVKAVANTVYLGGAFTTIRDEAHRHFAAFAPIGAPVITRQPAGGPVLPGQSVTLDVLAYGDPPLSFQWQCNGTNLPGASSSSLVIPDAQPGDAGDYTVVITNSLGLVSSVPVTLTLVASVIITSQPDDQVMEQGASVVFSVGASGSPAPGYQWRKNGVAIPGAIDAVLSLNEIQLSDAGRYSVTVFNGINVVESRTAELIVTAPMLALADYFSGLPGISSLSGAGVGDNANATFELAEGEPLHGGKPGGHSLWISWTAPANGIATVHTRGSNFDTLLAAYTFSTFGGLDPMDHDDDSGGFLTSEIAFNAVAGTTYHIAVDGYFGRTGRVALTWSLEVTGERLPRIQLEPASRSVSPGANVTFHVIASGGDAPAYQWLFNRAPLAGATNSFLFLPGVQPAHAGLYSVRISNGGRVRQSESASLEIGPVSNAGSRDKFEDLLLPGELAGSPVIPVNLGEAGSQIFNNTGARLQWEEPRHGDAPGGASRWMRLRPAVDGAFALDTLGSQIDTVLAVYTGTDLAGLTRVASDNDGAPDAARSFVLCPVRQGVDYFVAVDGVNGVQGVAQLNWRMGAAPSVSASTIQQTIRQGGAIQWTVDSGNAFPAPSYQWRLNGQDLAGATSAVLNLVNIQPNLGGTYSVVISNSFGVVIHDAARLTVAVPDEIVYELTLSENGPLFRFGTALSGSSVIEASTNLIDWSRLLTNAVDALIDYTDHDATNHPARFYRIVPWP